MPRRSLPVLSAFLCFCLGASLACSAPARERLSLNAGWRFAFGHPSDPSRDFNYGTGYFSDRAKAGYGEGAAAPAFDDRPWRQVDLPHDWAVEAPFDPRASTSHGFKAIGRGFPERSVGWYRRHLSIAAAELGRRISVEFEGVVRSSDVWINGFHLGHHESGYTGFAYDLTAYVNYGGDNALVVRTDASREEGWYYEGAGIDRSVWLVKTAALHFDPAEFIVTAETDAGAARVRLHCRIVNEGDSAQGCRIEHRILGPRGETVATAPTVLAPLAAGESREWDQTLVVPRPALWSPDTPALYRAVAEASTEAGEIDRAQSAFGIRTIVFDPNRGFLLNGTRVELQGTNNHEDFAGVGVAVPEALQEYRVRQLKALGINAWRCSHNPPSPALLEACDRLGMFVIDENRAFGAEPEQLAELANLIRRDRNHPSVILWSLGNEEWAVEGKITGARIIRRMQQAAHLLDPTRRTTYANSGGWGGISTVADVVGYNYIAQSNPDEQHARYPSQPGVGTEETSTQGTRGIYVDDRPHVHLSPQKKGDSGANAEVGWNYYAARPFLAGLFFWTGYDYRGEPTPFGWPAISSQFGLLDTCGFAKDTAYYVKAWWSPAPVLHLYPHWNWPGRDGQPTKVVCFTNDDEVELLLNGRSLGRRPVPRNGHLEWRVAYSPGRLEARGFRGGALRGSERIETTGEPASLVLSGERCGFPDAGQPVAIFTVSARDGRGRSVSTASNRIHFEATGGRIIGVGNGDPGCLERDSFPPSISLTTLRGWRGRIAASASDEIAPDTAGADFAPISTLGRWRAPLPRADQIYELAAAFPVPSPSTRAKYRLFLPAFGAHFTVWLNGRRLRPADGDAVLGPEIQIPSAALQPGENQLLLRVTPLVDGKNHIPELKDVGVFQASEPAPPAARSLFNGLARVIVLPTPGSIVRLEASSDGLAPGAAVLDPGPPRSSRP